MNHLEGHIVDTNMRVKEILWKFLIILNLMDMVLTFWGVNFLPMGINAEGNPVIRKLMEIFGPFIIVPPKVGLHYLTVFNLNYLVKECGCGILCCLIFLYLFAAVIPWTIIFLDWNFFHHLVFEVSN